MNCNEIQDQLNSYLDGVLSKANASEVEGHLRNCAACFTEYEVLQKLVRGLETSYSDVAPDHLRARIMASASRRPILLRAMLGIAAGIVVAVTTLILIQSNQPLEYSLPENGFVRASPGSVLRQIDSKTFKLERGKLAASVNSSITIQLDGAIIETESAVFDVTVDDPVRRSSVISASKGSLQLSGELVPFTKLRANSSQVINISTERKRQFQTAERLLDNMRETAPEFIELLASKNREEWIKVIGTRLSTKPDFLSLEQRRGLAIDLLSEAAVSDLVRGKKTTIDRRDAIWLFIALLDHLVGDIRYNAAWRIGEYPPALQASFSREAAISLAAGIADKRSVSHTNLNIAGKFGWALRQIADRLSRETITEAILLLETLLKNESRDFIRSELKTTLDALKQRLR